MRVVEWFSHNTSGERQQFRIETSLEIGICCIQWLDLHSQTLSNHPLYYLLPLPTSFILTIYLLNRVCHSPTGFGQFKLVCGKHVFKSYFKRRLICVEFYLFLLFRALLWHLLMLQASFMINKHIWSEWTQILAVCLLIFVLINLFIYSTN